MKLVQGENSGFGSVLAAADPIPWHASVVRDQADVFVRAVEGRCRLMPRSSQLTMAKFLWIG